MNTLNRLEPVPWSLSNGSDARSPDAYVACLRQFNFDSADRYAPELATTYCNVAVSDSARALGCYVPHVHNWYSSGYQTSEYDADDLVRWLMSPDGGAFGWMPVDADDARSKAGLGFPTLVTWLNASGSGHIAWLCPDGTLAQAGARCGYGLTMSEVFTTEMMPQLRFWTHA